MVEEKTQLSSDSSTVPSVNEVSLIWLNSEH